MINYIFSLNSHIFYLEVFFAYNYALNRLYFCCFVDFDNNHNLCVTMEQESSVKRR